MKMRRIALWFTAAVFTLLVLTVTWLWNADLTVFKPQVEKWVSEKTGREFVIDGEFHVDLARHAVVIAENVRFQNAAWDDEPYMVEVGRFEIRLDIWSIYDGPLLVELIDVDDAQIRLVRPEVGAPNWDLQLQRAAGPRTEEDAHAGFDVLFELIDIDRMHIVVEAPTIDRPLDLRIKHLDQRHRDDGFLELDLQATLGKQNVSIEGEVGTWAALLAGQNVHFDLQGQLGTFEIETSGQVDDIGRPFRPSFQFSASGPDISDLTGMLGIGEDAQGDIDISGSLQPQQDGPLVLEVRGNIGETKIEAAGRFSNLRNLEQADIDLLASGPDLGRLLRLAGVDQVREAPFMINIDATRQGPLLVIERGQMVFADAEFDISAHLPDFPSVDGGSIALEISGPDIERFRFVTGLPGAAKGAFSIGFELGVAPNGREALKLDVTTSLGQIHTSGQLGDAPDYLGSTLDFQLRSNSLARLASAYGIENLPDRALSIVGSAILEDGAIRTTKSVTVNVDGVSISLDGLLALSDGNVGSELSFNLVGPSLAALTGAFGVSAGIPDQPFDVDGKLRVRKEGYRLADITAMIGSSKLNFDGLLAPTPGLVGSNVTFALSGPAFEEVIDAVGNFEVRPGAYELEGRIELQSDLVQLDDIKLERENSQVSVSMELGLPVSRRWANFKVSAGGNDVRSVLRGVNGYQPEGSPFFVDVRGELRQANLSLDQFALGIADARVQARGDLDFSAGDTATRLSFTGDIPSLAQLGQFAGRRFRDQSIAWAAEVTDSGGVLTVKDLDLTLGQSDVSGFVRYTKGDVPKLEINITSQSIEFDSLFEKDTAAYDPEPEFDDGRLIPNIAIPFDALRKLNATIGLSIGSLSRNRLDVRNVDLDVELREGVLDVRNASFDARSGWIRAWGRLEPAGDSGKASLQIVARDFALGLSQMNLDAAMTGDLDLKFESTGDDVRTLAGNLNGVLLVDTRGGRMANNRAFHAIYGDMLTEILNSVNPFHKTEPNTQFKCVVIPIEIVDGVISGAPNIFINTSKMRMASHSTVDLKTEKIDVNISSTPARGLSLSSGEIFNPYLKIVGTLAAPRLAVDEAGVLISGGAAVATGGLSVLAKFTWDRLSRSRKPCNDIAAKGREALGSRFPVVGQASDGVASTH